MSLVDVYDTFFDLYCTSVSSPLGCSLPIEISLRNHETAYLFLNRHLAAADHNDLIISQPNTFSTQTLGTTPGGNYRMGNSSLRDSFILT